MTGTVSRVKVFGERNTGTRAVNRMLARSANMAECVYDPSLQPLVDAYEARIAEVPAGFAGSWKRVYREALRDERQMHLGPLGAWKHAAPEFDPVYAEEGVGILFLVRNPYSWLLSLHAKPYHQLGRRHGPFGEFLVQPWLPVRRDNIGPWLASPMELWNRKLASYRAFEAVAKGVPVGFLRFEDFVHAPTHALRRVLEGMGYAPEGLTTERPTKPMGLKARERRHYYGRELWRACLSESDVAAINDAIDWNRAAEFGYARLDPMAFPEVAENRPQGQAA